MRRQRYQAKDFQPGDIIRINNKLWTIDRVEQVDPESCPESWNEWNKKGARRVHVCDQKGNLGRFTLPSNIYYRHLETIATAEDEGHWPVCQGCGEAWPCTHNSTGFEGRMLADKAIAVAQREFENPWPCSWCNMFALYDQKRFKTERGLKMHISKCRYNPNNWDFAAWLPSFSDTLIIDGGTRNGDPDSEAWRIAEAVKERAINGTLIQGPDARERLFGTS